MIKQHDYLFKVVIVGNQGVGKSALFLRFCDNTFVENYLATIGVDFRFKTIDIQSSLCKLQIWDTAGQQRFRTITSAYYRSAQIVLIVYDVTDPASFKQIEDYWLQQAKNNTDSNTMIFIVGNKADKTIEIHDADIQALANNVGIGSYFISAKTGDGVDKMFLQICQQLIVKEKLKPPKQNSNKKDKKKKHKGSIDLQDSEDIIVKKKCCKN